MKYELSILAKADLKSIFKYSLRQFGMEQAEHYTSRHPQIGRYEADLVGNIRCYTVEKHKIYYQNQLD